MSTASAVLRRTFSELRITVIVGTYVYRFGGIETMNCIHKASKLIGTYVYCFGGIETLPRKKEIVY